MDRKLAIVCDVFGILMVDANYDVTIPQITALLAIIQLNILIPKTNKFDYAILL